MDLVGFSMGTIEGVLGRPHFREFLLTFDYPEMQLVVARGSLDRSDPAVIGYDPLAGSIQFPIDVSGVSVPMVLDTGSQGGFTLPKAMESRFSFRSELQDGPTIRLVGGEHKTWRAPLEGTIRLSDISYEGPAVVLATISDEFGNIGFEVMRELKVTVDQANGLVRFERGVAAAMGAGREGGRAIRMGGPGTAGGPTRLGGPVRIGGPGGKARLGVKFEMTPMGFVKKDGGLVVQQVIAGGAAERAGLKAGDIVLAMAGTAVAEVEEVAAIAELIQGPRPLEMELLRNGERLTISID